MLRVLGLIACLLVGWCANAQTQLRVAIPSAPLGQGIPFLSSGPPNMYIAPAVFEGLTSIDGDGVLHPALATSWTASADNRTWTFQLREGVTFSNGTPFTADSVAVTLAYLTGQPRTQDLVAVEFEDVAGFRVLDAQRIEISLRKPSPFFPRAASVLFAVEPASAMTLELDGAARAPLGTGPFQVKSWHADRLELLARASSWRKAKVDRLTINFQPDTTARLQALLSGQIDVAAALAAEDRAVVEQAGGKLNVVRLPAVTTLMFLSTKPRSPVGDVRVRQALNYAVDKKSIVTAFFDGAVPIAGQPAAPNVLGFNASVEPYPYDPDRARALLKEAGYSNGLSLVLEAVVGSSGSDGAIYQQVAVDLAKIGVKMEVRAIPNLKFGQNFRSGDWAGDAFAFFYGAEPALDGLRPLKYYRCSWPHTAFCDASAENLLKLADDTADPAQYTQRAQAVMARYHDLAPGLFLYQSPRYHGVSKRVSNFHVDHNVIRYDEITLNK